MSDACGCDDDRESDEPEQEEPAAWWQVREIRAAAVAGVPAAADFDPASLARPRIPLGLVTAGRDRWLTPRWHSDAVLRACTPCVRIAHLPDGGHSILLSPLPPPAAR